MKHTFAIHIRTHYSMAVTDVLRNNVIGMPNENKAGMLEILLVLEFSIHYPYVF